MIIREFADETFMAFADGELDDATAAAIESYGTGYRQPGRTVPRNRVQSKDALRSLLEEPVPEGLSRSVRRMIDEAKWRTVPSVAARCTV